MKTNTSAIRALALFGLIATLGPLAATAQTPVYFKIPFGFSVNKTSLSAGEYRVSRIGPSVLEIQSEDGHGDVMVMTQNGERAKNPTQSVLTFNRYGDQYFLTRMADPSRGWELPKSPGEKELAAQRVTPKPLAVVASSRR